MEKIKTVIDHAFTADELKDRAAGILKRPSALPSVPMGGRARRSDLDLNAEVGVAHADRETRPAAVLIPVIDRRPEASVLLTRRTETLSQHAGQIAFPGGKMDRTDITPTDTALREAEEEVGLARDLVNVIGFLETYQTVSNIRVAPAVAIVSPEFTLRLDESEVADAFEVPLRFLMSRENHRIHSHTWQGRERYYHAMPYGEHYIWGATAGILHNLYEWIYS